MKTFLAVFLLIGLSNSAVLDSKLKPDWDDEDSMILPSTSSPSPSILPEKNIDEDNVIQTEPKFISLIPKETYEDSRYEYMADHNKQQEDVTSDYSSSSSSVTPSTEEEGSTSDSSPEEEDSKKELPKTHLMQLGKIPLKLKVIPLLPPVHDQLLGSQNEKIEDFSGRSKDITTEDQPQQKSEEEEDVSDDVVRAPGQDNVPQTPLTYMIPPRMNEEDYWRKYPTEDGTDKESQVTPDSTINPILERLNDFLQKAKRHSIEQQQLQQDRTQNIDSDSQEDVDETKEEGNNLRGGPINFDSDENFPSLQSSTTESVENNPETMAPPQQDELDASYRQLVQPRIPQPGTPEVVDYQPQSQPLPFRQTLSLPSMDQVIPEYYYQNQIAPRSSISPSPYIYSSPNSIPSTPIPKEPLYTPPSESYWLRKYLYENILNGNRVTSPFSREYYNEYYRPQRNSYYVPSSALLNSIQDERPYYPSFPYGGYQTYGNFVPRRSAIDNFYSPSSYIMNQQRSSYLPSYPYYNSYYNSPMSRDFMYAPHFPYQQYRTISPSPQQDFF